MTHGEHEKRLSKRSRRSEAMLWRARRNEDFKVACLLEASNTGLAFAWRGVIVPAPNSIIDVQLDQLGHPGQRTKARVKRVDAVHEDLVIIAAELLHTRPFPPVAVVESKPRRIAEALPGLVTSDYAQLAA